MQTNLVFQNSSESWWLCTVSCCDNWCAHYFNDVMLLSSVILTYGLYLLHGNDQRLHLKLSLLLVYPPPTEAEHFIAGWLTLRIKNGNTILLSKHLSNINGTLKHMKEDCNLPKLVISSLTLFCLAELPDPDLIYISHESYKMRWLDKERCCSFIHPVKKVQLQNRFASICSL